MTTRDQIRECSIWLFVALLLLLFFLVSCNRSIPVASSDTIVRTVIRDRVKDTTIYLTDSAGLMAYLECDSMGQAKVKFIEDYWAGQFSKVPKVVIRNNWLKADCRIDSAAVYVAMKLSDTTNYTRIETVKVVKENYLTPWQWAQVWAGRLLMILGLISVLFFGLRLFVKKFPP